MVNGYRVLGFQGQMFCQRFWGLARAPVYLSEFSCVVLVWMKVEWWV